MLKTITEEPVMKEGKSETMAREARGPKPLMIKKQQSIDADDMSNEEDSVLHTTRTAAQILSEDDAQAQTLDVMKSIHKASESIMQIGGGPKLRTVKNKKQSKQILEMTGGASLLEQTNLTSRAPLQSEGLETETYYGDQSSEILSVSQHAQKQQILERVNKMGQPHAVMQNHLNNMNPLMFGDTIRLPFHI